jgi:hypothetical protein
MNINRQIQLGAAAVVANGILALTFLSPEVAHAVSCGPKALCVPVANCQDLGPGYCRQVTPPGCTLEGWLCTQTSCGVGKEVISCAYKPV